MRAAVITQPGSVELATVEDPAPGPREVAVEVSATGMCGTDPHILQGEFAPQLPIIPGHEFAGEVVARGSEVTEPALGDQVAVDPSLYCFECHYCRLCHNNLYERWAAIGVTHPGAAAEYAVAPVANCVPDLLATGVIDPRVFISDRLPLAAFPDAVARFQAGIGRKIQPGLATA